MIQPRGSRRTRRVQAIEIVAGTLPYARVCLQLVGTQQRGVTRFPSCTWGASLLQRYPSHFRHPRFSCNAAHTIPIGQNLGRLIDRSNDIPCGLKTHQTLPICLSSQYGATFLIFSLCFYDDGCKATRWQVCRGTSSLARWMHRH